MKIEDNINKDAIFTDFKPVNITKELKDEILSNPERYFNLSPRVSLGMFYTDEEKEKYIEESLNKPLPGDEDTRIVRTRNNK